MIFAAILILHLAYVPFIYGGYFGIVSLGCWNEGRSRTYSMPSAENSIHWLEDNQKTDAEKILACANVAYTRGIQLFAIQNEKKCVMTIDDGMDYKRYDSSETCKGRSKNFPVNAVYRVIAPPFVENLGCWSNDRDKENWAISSIETSSENYLDGKPKQRKDAFLKCAFAARDKGYDVFALENGGRCHSSLNANETYAQYGETPNRCEGDGTGGKWSSQVYKIVNRELEMAAMKRLGCWVDQEESAIPSIDLDDDVIGDARYKCFVTAMRRGFSVFALQEDGKCFSSENAESTFTKYGPSENCDVDGGGGELANEVYELGKSLQITNLGCWTDTSDHAIPIVEENPLYQTTSNPIYDCLNLAVQMGFDTFALQDGGKCATSIDANDRYDKYGPSEDCGTDGKGGLLANEVYKIEN
ncbi:unnamed protein product [Clavelina lepadiformis]|uniref:Uncharacterized protein n=1 Tax=Clavelina lepadiformis TaxID=159417 RepID=A0ABP0FWN5_CLALP